MKGIYVPFGEPLGATPEDNHLTVMLHQPLLDVKPEHFERVLDSWMAIMRADVLTAYKTAHA